MGDDHAAWDRSLLERLNALKPTSVSLDTSQNVLNIPTSSLSAPSLTKPGGDPPSREDALAARLRTLRNRSEGGGGGDVRPPTGSLSSSTLPAAAPPGDNLSGAAAATGETAQPPPSGTAGGASSGAVGPSPPEKLPRRSDNHGDEEADDPLYLADEAALHDLLTDLAGEEYDYDYADLDLNLDLSYRPLRTTAGPQTGPEAGAGADEPDKVAALLASLGKTAGHDEEKGEKGGDDDNSDDSDGEAMRQAVDDVLARARDEAELERQEEYNEKTPLPDSSPSEILEQKTSQKDEAGPGLQPQPHEAKTTNQGADAKPDSSDPFALPTVPTALVDPVPSLPLSPTPTSHHKNAISDLAARMAALKGVGTDASGLPAAPTFRPEDRREETGWRRPAGRRGFTDEDQKTWCVVCLEDATVRCLGCDDDDGVYCARCWREMHVGPAAGFDERGHKWVKFVR